MEAVENKFDDLQVEVPQNVLKISSPDLGLVSDKQEPFSHELCNRVLSYQEFSAVERPFRVRHCEQLINAMMRGTFHPEWVTFIVCGFNNTLWRMNGQHTAMARLEMPEKAKFGNVRVMAYKAESEEAMRELYASIDRGAPRTKSNIMMTYLGGSDIFADAKPTLVKLVMASYSFWAWEKTDRRKHDADDAAYHIQNTHPQLVMAVTSFCVQNNLLSHSWMRRQGVVGAMLETFSKVVKESALFWQVVMSGVGVDSADDPRLRLRNLLMEVKTTTDDIRVRSRVMDMESLYRSCISMFNAHRSGEKVKNIKPTKERKRAK